MAIIIFALVCGLALLVLLARSILKNTKYRMRYGTKVEKVCEIIKLIIFAETIAFIIVFTIVLIRTIMA